MKKLDLENTYPFNTLTGETKKEFIEAAKNLMNYAYNEGCVTADNAIPRLFNHKKP